MLFIPSHAPMDYYTKDYEKGLQLYSNGVLIMDKCADLLPDHFSFVRGMVDTADLSLNISREMLQHDRHLKAIAQSLEKKIKNELLKMQKDKPEDYEKFWAAFGRQIKYGAYVQYGAHKELLQDLLMYHSSDREQARVAQGLRFPHEGRTRSTSTTPAAKRLTRSRCFRSWKPSPTRATRCCAWTTASTSSAPR